MEGSQPPPMRASDAERDRVVRWLRDAAVDGRLSHDSFVQRVDRALRAKDQASLADLVADLAPGHGIRARLRTGLNVATGHLTGRPPTHMTLALPDRSSPVLVVGRRDDCDLVLSDTTVSRLHAVVMLFGGQWLVDDRKSTNGTRVNGRRIWGATAIRPGDRVSFGRVTFRLVPPPVAEHDLTPD